MLSGYITVSEFRRSMDKIDNYQEKANKVIKLLDDRVKKLAKLHIFHGDYKANNFMIKCDYSDLRILDFGKSKTYDEIEKICNVAH